MSESTSASSAWSSADRGDYREKETGTSGAETFSDVREDDTSDGEHHIRPTILSS